MLGLWGDDLKFVLPGFLPEMPRRPMTSPEIEVAAVERRLDLQVARIEVTALAKTYGLTQASRFVNLVELSGIRKTVKDRETGEKKLILPTQREAETLTGLQAGGISALVLFDKGFEVLLDEYAEVFEEIYVSGGERGLDIRIGVADFIALTNAKVSQLI